MKGDFVIRENSPELALVNNANIGLGMFQNFAVVSDGGVIDMSNVRFIHVVPKLFIYSLSFGNIDELTTEMCVKSKRLYDACLRCLDLGGLQRKMFEHGRIRDLNCGVSEIFMPGLIQALEYEPRSRDIKQGPVIEPSPFKKDTKFKGQAEVRVLFVPKEQVQVSEERLTIEIPEPTSLFEEVFRNYHRSDAADAARAGCPAQRSGFVKKIKKFCSKVSRLKIR